MPLPTSAADDADEVLAADGEALITISAGAAAARGYDGGLGARLPVGVGIGGRAEALAELLRPLPAEGGRAGIVTIVFNSPAVLPALERRFSSTVVALAATTLLALGGRGGE